MTQDNEWIYTNRVPFGLLTAQEQAELGAHDGPFQYYSAGRWWNTTSSAPNLSPIDIYRAVRPALVPDYIDWSHVAPEYKYMARDENGLPCLYWDIPIRVEHSWQRGVKIIAGIDNIFTSYRRGTVGWKDSLVTRPDAAK